MPINTKNVEKSGKPRRNIENFNILKRHFNKSVK
jgi:hypothetical protein